jgi:hypothetical protein
MRFIEQIPSFDGDAMNYLERQRILPSEFKAQLDRLFADSSLIKTVADDIYGLREAKLDAPQGGIETLLLIEHENGHRTFTVCVSIVHHPEEVAWNCTDMICKRKVWFAVGQLIMLKRAFGMGPNTLLAS